MSSFSVCLAQVFTGFSRHGNSIHNIIPLLKKKKCTSFEILWNISKYKGVLRPKSLLCVKSLPSFDAPFYFTLRSTGTLISIIGLIFFLFIQGNSIYLPVLEWVTFENFNIIVRIFLDSFWSVFIFFNIYQIQVDCLFLSELLFLPSRIYNNIPFWSHLLLSFMIKDIQFHDYHHWSDICCFLITRFFILFHSFVNAVSCNLISFLPLSSRQIPDYFVCKSILFVSWFPNEFFPFSSIM